MARICPQCGAELRGSGRVCHSCASIFLDPVPDGSGGSAADPGAAAQPPKRTLRNGEQEYVCPICSTRVVVSGRPSRPVKCRECGARCENMTPAAPAPEPQPQPQAAPASPTAPAATSSEDVRAERLLVPAGMVTMGSTKEQVESFRSEGAAAEVDPLWLDAERPQHRVPIDAYEIDKYPVTCTQYFRFCAETGHVPPEYWGSGQPPEPLRNHPVVCVSLSDAVAYADWAGGRLPYEREWEKAARATDGRLYPWGNEFDPAKANADRPESEQGTLPVNKFTGGASPYAMTDAIGNVREWTLDYCVPYAGEESNTAAGGAVEGKGEIDGVLFPNHTVARGGSYCTPKVLCRCAARIPLSREARLPDVGFRCAYTPDPMLQAAQALQVDKVKEALRVIRKALTLSPRNPSVLYHAATAYQRDGRLDFAINLWETLLRFWPDNEDAQRNLEECRKDS